MTNRHAPANDLRKLLHDAVRGVTDLVERSHDQVAGHVVHAASALGAGPPAEAIDALRRAITAASLIGVRSANAVVEAIGDASVAAWRAGHGPDDATTSAPLPPLRSDALGRADGIADAALGALNGAFGDLLADRAPSLDLGLSLRLGIAGPLGEAVLPDEPQALQAALAAALAASDGAASTGVALLVHGLAATEWGFCVGAAEHSGDPGLHLGARLQRDHGLLPVYVRYNSGRPIATNGAALTDRIAALVVALAAVGQAPRRLVLVGHSMGGLVIRDALARALEGAAPWLPAVEAVACLGSPHHGAPLERVVAGLATALGAVPLPGATIPAALLALRSAGIRDLAHGDGARGGGDDGTGVPGDGPAPSGGGDDAGGDGGDDRAGVAWSQRRWPEVPGARWLLVAGTVTPAAEAPSVLRASHAVLGDGMVSVRSALAEGWLDIDVEREVVAGVHHGMLPNHPAVAAALHRFLAGAMGR